MGGVSECRLQARQQDKTWWGWGVGAALVTRQGCCVCPDETGPRHGGLTAAEPLKGPTALPEYFL